MVASMVHSCFGYATIVTNNVKEFAAIYLTYTCIFYSIMCFVYLFLSLIIHIIV